jgi:hypothetical protein
MRSAVVTVTVIGVILALCACGSPEPKSAGGPAVMRRLTEDQYRQVVADIFGSDIVIGGRFDPINRQNGLLAVGAGATAINGSAFDKYDALARAIAGQVFDSARRDVLLPCRPANPAQPDDACARTFFTKTGRLLYRRPLTEKEIAAQVTLANVTTRQLGDFYAGMSASLSAMLVAPDFLFITDTTEPDPTHRGTLRLTAYAKAARLSFLLWNTTPDDALLTAAEHGGLDTEKGIKRQVDRMLASSRLETGVRAFFSDMIGFDAFETLQKDPVIYPAFGLSTANDAEEQTLRTITDLLVTHKGDYRDLFVTRKTFMTGYLGLVYRVPVAAPDSWVPYEFPQGDEHVGIQSQISFVALHSHPGRSSATLRGKAVREILLCQKVPDPPSGVDFTLVSDSSNPIYKTARQRLGAHSTNPTCAGCHKLMDPIGLTLENFDGAGQWRTQENGQPIDASGEFDGVKFADAAGLGKALHDSAAATSCLVSRLHDYALGRTASKSEKPWLAYLEKSFAEEGYRLPELLRRIAVSDSFYAVEPSRPTINYAATEAVKDGSS